MTRGCSLTGTFSRFGIPLSLRRKEHGRALDSTGRVLSEECGRTNVTCGNRPILSQILSEAAVSVSSQST